MANSGLEALGDQDLSPGFEARRLLFEDLGSLVRRAQPLNAALLATHVRVVNGAAVRGAAGADASIEDLAEIAAQLIRDAIVGLANQTERFVGTAMFALEPVYEQNTVGERRELLFARHGVTANQYADRRADILWQIVFALRRSTPVSPDDPSEQVTAATRLVGLQDVAEAALVFKHAALMACALKAWPILLREHAEPGSLSHIASGEASNVYTGELKSNRSLRESHIDFILICGRFLDAPRGLSNPHIERLRSLYLSIQSRSALPDAIGLAYLWGGSLRLANPSDRDLNARVAVVETYNRWLESMPDASFESQMLTSPLFIIAEKARAFSDAVPGEWASLRAEGLTESRFSPVRGAVNALLDSNLPRGSVGRNEARRAYYMMLRSAESSMLTGVT